MKKSIKSIAVLVSICAVVAILLACTNYLTAPIIEKNEQGKASGALLEVLPDGGSFELMDISAYTLPATVSEVYRAENGGYVFKLTTSGYDNGMVLMCGIGADSTVVGTKLISSNETPSIGGAAVSTFAPTLVGKDVTTIDGVDTVSGATKTTEGYRAAVKDALNAVVILGGGSVDLRTEEEILNDNLSAALSAANGEFEKHFFVEVVEGIDALYLAKNGAGAVCVIGEQFIAVDANNAVITDCSEADAQAATAAVTALQATTLSDVDISVLDGKTYKNVVSVQKTASGNYVIEVKANGYSMQNPYAPADQKKPIVIKVSLTAEGMIINTLTLSQNETDGIGSVCADEEFYGQFDGKTEADYDAIDAISGATVTTNGYKKAVLLAFHTVTALEGGVNE